MNSMIDLIPLSTPHNRRPGTKRKVEYIVVHNTSNSTSTARQERNWLTNPSNDRTASFHYAVDDNNIIQCIPDNEISWNAGDGQGKGNINGIAIEICESGNYKQAEANAIKLIQEKMAEYNLTIDKVKPHKFFSGKDCPHIILPYWDDFIKRIETQCNLPIVNTQLQNDVNILVKKGIIGTPEYWINSTAYDPAYVQRLIANAGGFDDLVKQNIITDIPYWKGNVYSTENVHFLLHKMAME